MAGPGALVPRRVGRQDQGRDLPRRRARGGDRRGTVGRDRLRIGRGLDPARERLGRGLDVGGQRRVVAPVIGRMVADDVDHRRRRLVGVVDVGEPVGHAGAEMQQGRRRVVGHPVIAVGRAGDHPLEEAEHAAHAVDPVERRDKMHLRGAGIGKAHIDAAADQGAHQAFRAIHDFLRSPYYRAACPPPDGAARREAAALLVPRPDCLQQQKICALFHLQQVANQTAPAKSAVELLPIRRACFRIAHAVGRVNRA